MDIDLGGVRGGGGGDSTWRCSIQAVHDVPDVLVWARLCRCRGPVSPQSSPFCFVKNILLIARYGTLQQRISYLSMTKTQLCGNQICLPSVMFNSYIITSLTLPEKWSARTVCKTELQS